MSARHKGAVIAAVTIIGTILIAIVIIVGIFFGSNVIQKAIIRAMCTDKPSSTPVNYEEILANTTLRSVDYSNGLALDIIEPIGVKDDALIVMVFHGGYYVGGGRHNQEPFSRAIASRGYRVLNADYSLAPEHKYPTQITEANAALNYALSSFPHSKGIVLTGDSAGAHLAAQLTAYVKDERLKSKLNAGDTIVPELLKGFIGSCGFYQASTVKDTGFLFIADALEMLVGANYLNSTVIEELNLLNYAASFPDTLLICGDKDPFLKENNAMLTALKSAGVRAETYFPVSDKNDLGHEFQCNYNIEESYTALENIIGFLDTLS